VGAQALTLAAEKAEAQGVQAAAGGAGSVLASNGARGPELVVDGGTLMCAAPHHAAAAHACSRCLRCWKSAAD
jgi:hypothetical protein